MRDFAYGTDAQFEILEQMLGDNRCHVYPDCILPDCCTPKAARMGFEKNCNGHYIVYIDKGINAQTDNQDFKRFLENGEIRFICLDDMVDFLHSLQSLFKADNSAAEVIDTKPQYSNTETATETVTERTAHNSVQEDSEVPVYDPEKIIALKSESETQKMVWPEKIATPLKEKIFGQDSAIDEIADKIVINQMRNNKKLLVMALIGPTATGKSETAKSLAEILSDIYKTPYGYIELAGNEFVGEHSVHRFFGAPPGYVGYGNETVLEPVRKNPKHVIVINEIEKADTRLLTALMEAIDTGYLGMSDNSKPIDLNQCIMFFTSNIPVNMEKYETLSKFERAEMCRDAFTKHCGRPEISGKIGNFVVFNALSETAIINIVVKFVREELSNYRLRLVHIDEELLIDFLKHQTSYGARGIRNLISDSIGERLLRERQLEKLSDKSVSLKGTIDNIQFEIA